MENSEISIIHIDFTGTFDDESTYQGVLLPKAHTELGYPVTVLTTCYCWKDGVLTHVDPGVYILSDGTTVRRLEYLSFGYVLTNKIRFVSGVYDLLDELQPSIIMIHGLQSLAILAIARYCADHGDIWVCADNHADCWNSAKTVSARLLHDVFYRKIINKIYPYLRRYYYTTLETKEFAITHYKVDEGKMEYLPLGGHIHTNEERECLRRKKRAELSIPEDALLVVHAGKLGDGKKTKEVLEAFLSTSEKRMLLWLCGSAEQPLLDDIKMATDKDERIRYTGWISGIELEEMLVAADLCLQPGTQSAIIQNAVCCGTVVAVYPYRSYMYALENYAYYVTSKEDICSLLKCLTSSRDLQLKQSSLLSSTTIKQLDYKWQAQHIVDEALGSRAD